MSHGFENCAGLSAMRSAEDLSVFAVLSRKKKIYCKVSKTYLFTLAHGHLLVCLYDTRTPLLGEQFPFIPH